MNALFALENVRLGHGRRTVLRELSFHVEEGGITALLGPNGSGKTTLLRALMGVLAPKAGTIRFRGRDIRSLSRRALARRIAYLPQQHRPVFPYTVEEVARLGLLPRRGPLAPYTAADRALVRDCLAELGLEALAGRPYTEISGGERQLTLLARALIQGADVAVMDEPESALDFGNQRRLLVRIAALADGGRSCVFSTHLPEHALAVADRAVLLAGGRVLDVGPTASVVTPEHLAIMYGIEAKLAFVEGMWRVLPPPVRKHGSLEE
ncbi:ABC transporter related protein [Solidesulfovibrio fructosivorans JJ]]|uniref:ABC transporter related protein n=1 Tax=Solidesulfovibrio fructosivorans JJ] TaxID=596151 RepID=E1JU66_SOLFR|nr:ABC transporter ATP-binding protein [Solidesulfovibrio fructosivorans]EFL51996.1 ABC transporter related protein [Solidesulfovibrio fructosivorans JJ]]